MSSGLTKALLLIVFLSWSTSCFASQKGKLHLIFTELNYTDVKEFAQDRDALLKKLQQTKPFDEFPDAVIAQTLELSPEQKEKAFKPTSSGLSPYEIDPDFLESLYNEVVVNFKLIILDGQSSSACAQVTGPDETSVIVLGRQRYGDDVRFAKAFLHELGHSLGLHDESPAKSMESSVPGYPNCATTREDAEKWWGDLVGKDQRVRYIHGCCGNMDYFRPTIASLMNDITKAEDFGPVNERYLREILKD